MSLKESTHDIFIYQFDCFRKTISNGQKAKSIQFIQNN